MPQARQIGAQARHKAVLLDSCLCLGSATSEAGWQTSTEPSQGRTKRAVSLGLDLMVFVTNHKILVPSEPDSPPLRKCLLRSIWSHEGTMNSGVMSITCPTQYPIHTTTKPHGAGPVWAQSMFSIQHCGEGLGNHHFYKSAERKQSTHSQGAGAPLPHSCHLSSQTSK